MKNVYLNNLTDISSECTIPLFKVVAGSSNLILKPSIMKTLFQFLKMGSIMGLFIILPVFSFSQMLPENEMRAHYVNVGQANATLLEFSCGAILIDAGAEGPVTREELNRYLERFFNRRTDLNKTLSLVIVTHAHTDHNKALKDILTKYKVLNYVDNGLRYGSGRVNQKWAQDNAQALGYQYASYSYDQAALVAGHTGISNLIIDPVNCSGTNPKISILSGRFQALPPNWTQYESDENGNLHSLVVKIEFGQSSFLFTGDLELKAMHQVVKLYNGTRMLDSDVWEVSHHGSYNGTTSEWLRAVTPKYAIIPSGKWNSGIGTPPGSMNTYNFGHPRVVALDMLAQFITGDRPPLDSIEAFSGIRDAHRKYKVSKNIYSGAWDGTIVLRAFKNGTYVMITP
jgi:competence protein ComEC